MPTPPAAPLIEHSVPVLHPADVPDRAQGGLPRHRDGCGLLEGEPGRFGYHPVGRGAGDIGERALDETEHLVTDIEPTNVRADGLHDPGRVDTGHAVLRLDQSDHSGQPRDVRVPPQHVPVVGVERSGVHADQHVVGPDVWSVGVHELQDVGGTEPLLNDRLHGLLPSVEVYGVHLVSGGR